jgi:hypothetical protein
LSQSQPSAGNAGSEVRQRNSGSLNLRRLTKSDLALRRKTKDEQIELLLPDEDVQLWEYTVLVTNSIYPLDAMASYTATGPMRRTASMS